MCAMSISRGRRHRVVVYNNSATALDSGARGLFGAVLKKKIPFAKRKEIYIFPSGDYASSTDPPTHPSFNHADDDTAIPGALAPLAHLQQLQCPRPHGHVPRPRRYQEERLDEDRNKVEQRFQSL